MTDTSASHCTSRTPNPTLHWTGVAILTAIAPLVLIGAWLFLRYVDRAEERKAAQLAVTCKCPTCDDRTLVWNGERWMAHVLYGDKTEKHLAGYTLRCSRCNGAFQFTAAGEVHEPATGAA